MSLIAYTLVDQRGAVFMSDKWLRSELYDDLENLQEILGVMAERSGSHLRQCMLSDKISISMSHSRKEDVSLVDILLWNVHLFDGVDSHMLLQRDLFTHQWYLFQGKCEALLRSLKVLMPDSHLVRVHNIKITEEGIEVTFIRRKEFFSGN